jgi:ABC-type nitrate/sulfonate/bicarbonate transport system substrate-binding protein
MRIHSISRREFAYAATALALWPAAARGQASLSIRIGTDPTDTYAEPYYAQDMGFFKNAGLDAQVIDLQNGAVIAHGTIDAGLISEPSLTIAKAVNDVRVLAHSFDGVATTFLLSAWFTTQAYVQKNPEIVKRFVAATYDAGKWANAHHAETATILAKYSKLELATLRSMARSKMSDSLDVKELQPQLDVALKYGVLPKYVSAADMIAK